MDLVFGDGASVDNAFEFFGLFCLELAHILWIVQCI